MIEVRKRKPGDVAQCVTILKRVYDEFLYPAQWPQDPAGWIANDTERDAWVAIDGDGKVVGHIDRRVTTRHPITPLWCEATGKPANDLAVVSRLFVDPGHFGTGVGTTLLAEATKQCHKLNLLPVVSVLAEHEGAIAFYEKRGWTQVGIADDTWAEAVQPIRVVAMVERSTQPIG